MNGSDLSLGALQQIGKLEKKLSEFMEQKNHEISALQSQVKELQGNKRTILLDTEEKSSNKKVKTENGNPSSGSDPFNLRYDGDWVMVYTDGACPNNGKGGARAGLGVWWNHGHKHNVSARVKGRLAQIKPMLAIHNWKYCKYKNDYFVNDSCQF